eukprot:scaffold139778_cov105-Phaeocystis_antarctica.AAC.1
MFAGRFLVRHDLYGLIRRHVAPRLSLPRATGWCRQFLIKSSSSGRAGCRTPLQCAMLRPVCADRDYKIMGRNCSARSIGHGRRCPSSKRK